MGRYVVTPNEQFSQLYAFLGDRTSNPDGDEWDHDRLRASSRDLAALVDRIAKERAADEMRAVAHRLDDGGDEAIEVALGGAVYVHRVLCDTAHALDGKP